MRFHVLPDLDDDAVLTAVGAAREGIREMIRVNPEAQEALRSSLKDSGAMVELKAHADFVTTVARKLLATQRTTTLVQSYRYYDDTENVNWGQPAR